MECNDANLFDLDNHVTYAVLEAIWWFGNEYSSFHRWIASMLCVCGIFANSVHIWVLTRPEMKLNFVQTVLVSIAVADMGTMLSYLIYLLRFEFFRNPAGYFYGWALFLEMHISLSIALHAITLYLVVLMTFFRLRSVTTSWKFTATYMTTTAPVVLVILFVFVTCIPTFLAHQIKEIRTTDTDEHLIVGYSVGFSDLMISKQCWYFKANLWLTGMLLKAVPCVLLLCFTSALIYLLRQNDERRRLLLQESKYKTTTKGEIASRTMFLMVTVFLTAELPQGVMAITNAIYTSQFHKFVYLPLADLLDLLSLINCYVASLSFVLTCSKYRQILYSTMHRGGKKIRDVCRAPFQALFAAKESTVPYKKFSTVIALNEYYMY